MRDIDRLDKLKKRYLHLVEIHGTQVAEFNKFRKSLLELNRRHRSAAMKMFANVISRIEKKTKAK